MCSRKYYRFYLIGPGKNETFFFEYNNYKTPYEISNQLRSKFGFTIIDDFKNNQIKAKTRKRR